jgi:glycosyltransferase involved in cell wall biosynthesis
MAGNGTTTELTTLKDYVRSRVSVVIPTYNYSHFILDAVKSVLAQDVRDLEVIVVDDGSTDNTCDVIEPYTDRVKYIYQENAGLSAARNTGICKSSGEFILFLDADDVLGPHSIASQVSSFESNPVAAIVVCENKLFRETDRNGRPKPFGSWPLFQRDLPVHLCYFNIAPPHAFLFRRQVIIETGWFDEQLTACEDYDFWLRAAVSGFVPHYNPSGLVYYRRHPESMSADLKNQHLHDAILHKRLSTLLDQYPKFPEDHRFEGLLAFATGAILTSARLHGHSRKEAEELIELAHTRLVEAETIISSEQKGWNILSKLFHLRIVSTLAMPCFRNSHTAEPIREILSEILTAVNAPVSKAGILADVIKTCVIGLHGFYPERREIRTLPLRYLKNRFSSF